MQQTRAANGRHGDGKSRVRSIKERLCRRFGKNVESLIDREILAAINQLDRSSQSPRGRGGDLGIVEEEIEDNIARKIEARSKGFSSHYQSPFISS